MSDESLKQFEQLRLRPMTLDDFVDQLVTDAEPTALCHFTMPVTAVSRWRQDQPLAQFVSVTKPEELGGAWSEEENSKPEYTVGVDHL